MFSKENVSSNILVKFFGKATSTNLFWIGTFSIFMIFSAQLAVPVKPVPFTLQTMIVLLSGAFLGSRNGMLSQAFYLGMGVIGIPVFAAFTFGFPVILGPTGGYLLAFPLAAFVVGYLIERKNTLANVVFAMTLGSLVILLTGSLYLSLFFGGNLSQALFAGAIIFSVWDIIKIAAAASIYSAIAKKYPKLPV